MSNERVPAAQPSGANVRGAVDLSALVNAQKSPVGPTDGTVPSLVLPATDASFTGILELSKRVPVIVEFYAPTVPAALGALVESFGGRLVLATVDGTTNPQLAQAFQVEEVPTVAAVIGGRPLQLFVGMPPADDLRKVLEQVLVLAAEEGVTGSVTVAGVDADIAAPPAEEPLPPHHQEAFDAIAAGDYATAIAQYQKALVQNPRDQLAVAGLAQVGLLARTEGKDAEVIHAALKAPRDSAAQLAAADYEVSTGQFEAAFHRLLTLFPELDATEKNTVRTRLLDYFEIVGVDDPVVTAARRRLTGLLY